MENPNTFTRHRGPVTCTAGVPDTDLIATSAYDGAVALYSQSAAKVELLGYHDHLANRIVVHPDGTLAASPSSDYSISIWDLEQKSLLTELRGHLDDVEDFVFAEADLGVSVSRDKTIRVWNIRSGELQKTITGHEKDVLSVAYYNKRLYTSGDDMTLRVWDLESGEAVRMWGPFETETDTCAMDPSAGRVVLGCDDGCVRVFDIESGLSLGTIEAHASAIKKVAVSPDNGNVLSAAYDQKIRIWNAADFSLKVELEGHPAKWERSFSFAPDGKQVYAGTFDGTVLVWDAESGKLMREIGDMTIPGNACFNDIAADESGRMLTVSDDGLIRTGILNQDSGLWQKTFEIESGRILMNACHLDVDQGLAVAGAHNQKIHILDYQNGTLSAERAVALHEGPVNCIRVSGHPGHEGESYVACYSGAIVRVSREGLITGKFSVHENAVKSLRLHPREAVGVSCSADGILVSWNLEGKALQEFESHAAIINDLDLDPSGQYLASVGRDFVLNLYKLSSGEKLESWPLGKRSLKSVCFFDETHILVGDYWGGLILVRTGTGEVYRTQVAENGISALARSGDTVLAASYDGTAYCIDPATLNVVRQLKAMTQRVTGSAYA